MTNIASGESSAAPDPAVRETPLVELRDDLQAVAQGDLVLCAANPAQAFLGPAHFKEGAVVCDVAIPANVEAGTRARRPDLWLARGGIVATPHGESLPAGTRAGLAAGQVFACMAETAVMGLAGMDRPHSLGDLSLEQVWEIEGLARLHGFRLAEARTEDTL